MILIDDCLSDCDCSRCTLHSPQTSILIVNGGKYSPQYSNLHIQMLLPTHFLNVRFYLSNWLVALNFPYNIGSSLETKALVLISTDDRLLFGIILCCVDTKKLTKNRHKRNIWVLMRPTFSRMWRALHKMAQSNLGRGSKIFPPYVQTM